MLKIHKKNIVKKKKHLGYHELSTFNLQTTVLTLFLIRNNKNNRKRKKAIQSEIIFTHHMGDVNIDHQKTFEAVLTAVRPLEGENVKHLLVRNISGTEWISSSDPRKFSPNLFISLNQNHLKKKIRYECISI